MSRDFRLCVTRPFSKVSKSEKFQCQTGHHAVTHVIYTPAMQYNTPVTMHADTCFCMIAKVPTTAAAAKSMRLTMKHDAAEFCIPEIIKKCCHDSTCT